MQQTISGSGPKPDMGASDDAVPPGATELFYASLVATILVYGAGAVIFSGFSFLGTQTGGLMTVAKSLIAFATIGAAGAGILALVLVAPLGTAFGLVVMRLSRPAWWQGPLTGALVALALEALVVFGISQEALDREMGNAVMLAIPVALAMIAGAFVQRKILRWPDRR